jgi:hypothetical protein
VLTSFRSGPDQRQIGEYQGFVREIPIALPSDQLSLFEFRYIALNRLLATALVMLDNAHTDIRELAAGNTLFFIPQVLDQVTPAAAGCGVAELLVRVIQPEQVQLLFPDDIDLGAELIDETAKGENDKRDDVAAGFAGDAELPVVLGPRFVVVIAQHLRCGKGQTAISNVHLKVIHNRHMRNFCPMRCPPLLCRPRIVLSRKAIAGKKSRR